MMFIDDFFLAKSNLFSNSQKIDLTSLIVKLFLKILSHLILRHQKSLASRSISDERYPVKDSDALRRRCIKSRRDSHSAFGASETMQLPRPTTLRHAKG